MEHPNGPVMALVTIEGNGLDAPTLAEAAEQLGVQPDSIDHAFGILAINLQKTMFAVRVRADALPEEFQKRDQFRGPFADPEIGPL